MSAGTFITLTTREARKAHALAHQREVADLLSGQGLGLEVKNDGEHWIVRDGRRIVVQWWPSSAKIAPGETWKKMAHARSVEEFVAFVGTTLRLEREHPPTVLPENRDGLRVVKHRGQVAGYARNLGSRWEPLDARRRPLAAAVPKLADATRIICEAAAPSRGGARYMSELTLDERAAVTATQGSGFAPGSPMWSDPVTEYRHLCAELDALPSGDRTPEQDARVTEIVERCDDLWRGFSRSQEARAKVPLRKSVDPEAAALIDASLHPAGRCTCGDTGACAWCVETDRKLDEEAEPEDDDPVVCGGCYAIGAEPHAGYCIDARIAAQLDEERHGANLLDEDQGDDHG